MDVALVAFILACLRKDCVGIDAGLYPHQLASLAAMTKAENSNLGFGALRGGVLGDAPGLGKVQPLPEG
jgi:hypothetical protein